MFVGGARNAYVEFWFGAGARVRCCEELAVNVVRCSAIVGVAAAACAARKMLAATLLSATSFTGSSAKPLRLTVNGSSLLDPSAPRSVPPAGFNWQSGRTGPDPGGLMKQLAPGATVARLVGVLWGNTDPLQSHPNKECMTMEPPHYFNDKCFDDLDPWVKSATDAGLWVILAVRGEYVAGQKFETDPGSSIFRNATLANMSFAMWRHVAAH